MYKVIDRDGYTLLETDEPTEVIKAVYEDEKAYAVLRRDGDGVYRIDETDW